MGSINKGFSLLFAVVLAVLGLIMVEPVFAQSIPKPSVPEFTVALVSHPYEVAETTQIDPYTGAVTTYPSYIAENKSIEITIKNQPFTSTQMVDGNWSRLYYNIRFKGHFYTGDWSYYPVKAGAAGEGGYITASNSDYTTIALPKYLSLEVQPKGSQIDFQVKALIGYDEAIYRVAGNTGELVIFGIYFTGEASDWSNTQTMTIPETSILTSPTPNPTPTPTIPEFPSWTILMLFTVLAATVGLRFVTNASSSLSLFNYLAKSPKVLSRTEQLKNYYLVISRNKERPKK